MHQLNRWSAKTAFYHIHSITEINKICDTPSHAITHTYYRSTLTQAHTHIFFAESQQNIQPSIHLRTPLKKHTFTHPSENSESKPRSAPRFRADQGDVSIWTIACRGVGEAITWCWMTQCRFFKQVLLTKCYNSYFVIMVAWKHRS